MTDTLQSVAEWLWVKIVFPFIKAETVSQVHRFMLYSQSCSWINTMKNISEEAVYFYTSCFYLSITWQKVVHCMSIWLTQYHLGGRVNQSIISDARDIFVVCCNLSPHQVLIVDSVWGLSQLIFLTLEQFSIANMYKVQ